MNNIKMEILDNLSQNRDYYKEITVDIRSRRNQMYYKSNVDQWDEINHTYTNALFVRVFDKMSQELNLPIDEMYCILEEIDLSSFFEPSN